MNGMSASFLAVGTALMAFFGVLGSALDLEYGAQVGIFAGFVALALCEWGLQSEQDEQP